MRSNQLSYRAIAAPKGSSLICECKGKAFSFTHQTFRRKKSQREERSPHSQKQTAPSLPSRTGQGRPAPHGCNRPPAEPSEQAADLPPCCVGATLVSPGQRPLGPASIAQFGQMRPSTGRHKCRPYLPGAAASRAVGTSRRLVRTISRLVRTISRAGSPRPGTEKAGCGTWSPHPACRSERQRFTYTATT